MSVTARHDAAPLARRLGVLGFAAMLMFGVACHNGPQPQTGDDDQPAADLPTILQVVNQQFSNMTIYVLRTGQRLRLGLAIGNSTTAFVIPRPLVSQQATQLRFLADPIGGAGTPVSDEITVSPGDSVQLTIPPG